METKDSGARRHFISVRRSAARYVLTLAYEGAATWYQRYNFQEILGGSDEGRPKMYLDLLQVSDTYSGFFCAEVWLDTVGNRNRLAPPAGVNPSRLHPVLSFFSAAMESHESDMISPSDALLLIHRLIANRVPRLRHI